MVLEIDEQDSMFTVKWQVNSHGFSQWFSTEMSYSIGIVPLSMQRSPC
jgi:hypothetical protein